MAANEVSGVLAYCPTLWMHSWLSMNVPLRLRRVAMLAQGATGYSMIALHSIPWSGVNTPALTLPAITNLIHEGLWVAQGMKRRHQPPGQAQADEQRLNSPPERMGVRVLNPRQSARLREVSCDKGHRTSSENSPKTPLQGS